jgi:nicotinate-nucleotide adenylyltransferase
MTARLVNQQTLKTVGVFGGTFDPIHKGHLQVANFAKSLLNLDEIRLLPCHLPPHRSQPQLSSAERLSLLELAVKGNTSLVVDDRELRRDGPSYTVDTLKDLRDELGAEVSIVLLMGADSYLSLMHWHKWQLITTLSHIGVMMRPGYSLPQDGVLADWLDKSEADEIYQQSAGIVFTINQPEIDVSATEIRRQLKMGIMSDSLPAQVQTFIAANHLYGYDGDSKTLLNGKQS